MTRQSNKTTWQQKRKKAPSMMTTGHSQTQTMIELTNALLPALKTQQLEKSSPTKLADSSSIQHWQHTSVHPL